MHQIMQMDHAKWMQVTDILRENGILPQNSTAMDEAWLYLHALFCATNREIEQEITIGMENMVPREVKDAWLHLLKEEKGIKNDLGHLLVPLAPQ